MANIFCVCGPNNSYFCNSPSKWVRQNLPKALETNMVGDDAFSDAYHVALGPNGSYYMGGKKKTKFGIIDTFRASTNLPHDLYQWLNETTPGGYGTGKNKKSLQLRKRDIPSLRVVLGPSQSYFAIDKGSYAYGGLPKGLTDFFESDGIDIRKDPVKVIALGYGGAYFVLTHDGCLSYDLTGTAKNLDEWFDENNKNGDFTWARSIKQLCLCAVTPGRYFMTMENGSCYGSNPKEWDPIIQPVWDDIVNHLKPKPQAHVGRVAVAPARRAAAPRQQGSGLSTLMGGLKIGLKVLNDINKATNGGGNGGGNGGDGGGGDSGGWQTYDTTDSGGDGFWQPIQSAASDPIQ